MFPTSLTLQPPTEVSQSLIRAVSCDIYAPIYESGRTKYASLGSEVDRSQRQRRKPTASNPLAV
jgi:hypothetical protein